MSVHGGARTFRSHGATGVRANATPTFTAIEAESVGCRVELRDAEKGDRLISTTSCVCRCIDRRFIYDAVFPIDDMT
jgi:hypothetical protein